MSIVLLFIICTAVNVILSTVKSICTVNGGKWIAAFMNALTYGFYSYVIILTNVDGLSTLAKMFITAICNFVGVFIVKLVEEKTRKERLWKIEATFSKEYLDKIDKSYNIPHSYIDIGNHVIFNFYAKDKEQSKLVKDIVRQYHGKYFVSESKIL